MPRDGDQTRLLPPGVPTRLALPAPAPAAPAGPSAEERPVRPRPAVYVLAILVLAISALLGFLLGTVDHRNEPRELLSDAFRHVRQADVTVGRVGEAVRDGVTVTPAAIRAAEAGVPAGRESLLAALDELGRAERGLKGPDLQRARALRKAAEGRLAMLRSASLLLPLQSRASTAFTAAEDGWASVRVAAVLADDAAQAFNTHTRAGVTSSTVLTQRAQSELASAYAALHAAARVMPEADLKGTLDYVARKRESITASRKVDDVWLRGDVAGANRMVAQLAVDDVPLEALLKSLPKSAGSAVRAAFDVLAADLADDYAIGERLAREGDAALAAVVSAPQPSE